MKKRYSTLICALLTLLLLFSGCSKTKTTYRSSNAGRADSATQTESHYDIWTPAVEADTQSAATGGKADALRSAQSYLSFMSFSYTGLIEQLEYEGYTHEEATYAADNCGADWYAQAVACARSYLSYMSFSRSELIDQLVYEGFTYDQASRAADKTLG